MAQNLEISAKEFSEIGATIYDLAGIRLNENKKSLVEGRLMRRLSELKVANFTQYVQILKTSEVERGHLIEALTTHKTDWFREAKHFSHLPRFSDWQRQNGTRPLMIWSGACSTGEEVYSLAIELLDRGWSPKDFRILGTDISQLVVDKATQAQFSLSKLKVEREFSRISAIMEPTVDKDSVQVKAEIRRSLKFRQMNLLELQLPYDIQFDFIFLRNVLIYFDAESTDRVIKGLMQHLQPTGLLIIGMSETLRQVPAGLSMIGDSRYKRAA